MFKQYLKVATYIKYICSEVVVKIILGLIVTATYVGQAICLARGTAVVFSYESFRSAAIWYLGVLALIISRSALIRYLEGYTKEIGGRIKAVLREQIVDKLLRLGPAYQNDKRSGRMQSLATDGVEYLEAYLVNYIPQVFIVIFSVIPMVIYIYSLNLITGMILTAAIIFAVVVPHMLMPWTSKASIGYWRGYAVLNSQYVDTMQGMNTLKIFAAQNRKGDELRHDSEEFRHRQIVNTRNSLISSAMITLMMAVGTSITTGVAAYTCSDGEISYAELLTIMFLTIECVRPVGEMNTYWHSSFMGLSVSKEFLEIMEETVLIKSPENAEIFPERGVNAEIRFNDVNFRYSSNREVAVNKLSFSVDKGSTVAFVGESGSDKSTIINLLLRFYDVEQGSICIRDKDIRTLDLRELRNNISIVFQNSYLFFGTVRDNIKMARPDATDEEAEEAARIARAHEFIISLEDGYETIVGERGVTLSGGQRQRIAIARAVLKDAPILVLDEATSSVDAATEKMIQETLEELHGRYTMLVIAHRLSTIRNAEMIFVLDNGKIVEQGTHDDLFKKKDGLYRGLIEAQEERESC